jgi:phosphoribosylformimino-5-aminoimidazole carboxamide ribonucleotide (ProFAR) isomerase
VPFTLLPAIDVTAGRLGVYRPDGPVPVDAFGGDPVAAASAFRDAGASWIHVVDMDLAFTGELRNVDVVRAIVRAVPEARIQASGGVATEDAVVALRDAGAARVVIGSAALHEPREVRGLLDLAAGTAIVGIEVTEGRIRARGGSAVDLDLMSTLGWLALTPGVRGVLVTSVARVGGLAGPDVDLVRRVMRRGFRVLAAGGVRSVDDLVALRDAGAVGAVIGRAAIEGGVDLSAAVAWARV